MQRGNPCLHCGACCAYYRVSFYWSEADEGQGGLVPFELTEEVTPLRRCMKGTNQKQPRCVALQGEIGRTVRCSIYPRRPSPCRKFGITCTDGLLRARGDEQERCNRARAAWGLPPFFGHPRRQSVHRRRRPAGALRRSHR